MKLSIARRDAGNGVKIHQFMRLSSIIAVVLGLDFHTNYVEIENEICFMLKLTFLYEYSLI